MRFKFKTDAFRKMKEQHSLLFECPMTLRSKKETLAL